MPRPPAKPEPKRLRMRDRMLEWAEENWDEMVRSLEEGLAAMKQQNAYCPRCQGRVEVRFPDLRVRNDTVRLVAELSGSKPRPDSDTGGGGFVVKRTIVAPDKVDA